MERNVNRKKWYFLPYGVTDKAMYWKTQEYKPIAISNNHFFGGRGLWRKDAGE